VNSFDLTILQVLNEFVGRWPEFDRFVAFLSWQNILKGGALVTVLWWAWFSGRERARELVLATLFGSFIAIAMTRFLASGLAFRPRPLANPELNFHVPIGLKAANLIEWSSFPSDHAALFVGLATGLCFISRRVGIGALAYTVVVILFPRLYGGIHHPTDLIVGGLIGVGCVVATCTHPGVEKISSRFLAFEKQRPALFYAALFLAFFEIAELFEGVRNSAESTLRLMTRLHL
jgi:undecaprenyl-diphosphatase